MDGGEAGGQAAVLHAHLNADGFALLGWQMQQTAYEISQSQAADVVEDDDGKVVGFGVCCCGDEAVMALLDALNFATLTILDPCMTRAEKSDPMKVGWSATD